MVQEILKSMNATAHPECLIDDRIMVVAVHCYRIPEVSERLKLYFFDPQSHAVPLPAYDISVQTERSSGIRVDRHVDRQVQGYCLAGFYEKPLQAYIGNVTENHQAVARNCRRR